MAIPIKATGATFNAARSVALGEHDVKNALELAVGKSFGTISAGLKSTISNEKVTQSIVDWARGRPVKDAEARKRIQNVLSLAGASEIKPDLKLISPVNIIAALTCLGKGERDAALKVLKLLFIMKEVEFKAADKLVAGYFGGSVRQAVSGGFTEFGKEKVTGFEGMSKAAKLALDAIEKELR